jgi:hypothetical protein
MRMVEEGTWRSAGATRLAGTTTRLEGKETGLEAEAMRLAERMERRRGEAQPRI